MLKAKLYTYPGLVMPKKYIMNLFHELSRLREKKINKI